MNLVEQYLQSPFKHEGKMWYAQTRMECLKLAWKYNIRLETSVGIVAVLSPVVNWNKNIEYAENLIRGEGVCGAMGANKAKATKMLLGACPLDVLSGNKVVSFYNNILYAGLDNEVTIDRWMLAILGGPKFTPRPNLYFTLADKIREAAQIVCVPPPMFQATLWITSREASNAIL